MGRWKTYRTPGAFAKAVDAYFNKIAYKEIARAPSVWVSGKYVQGEEIHDKNGNPMYVEKYTTPPSLIALQNDIKISHETWRSYGKQDGYKEVVEYATRRCEEYYAGAVVYMGREGRGAEFILKYCYGYDKRQETVTGNDTPEDALSAALREAAERILHGDQQ